MLFFPFTLVLLKNIFLRFLNSCCICQLFCPAIHSLQMKALKDLGLDVKKGTVTTDSDVTQTKFHIMRLWVLATFCLLYFCVCVYVWKTKEYSLFMHLCNYTHFLNASICLSAQCEHIYACACIHLHVTNFLDYTLSLFILIQLLE